MNGYRTIIFELHDKPGGVCTSWKRKGYVFDYYIHNLSGTAPDSTFHEIWNELKALEGLQKKRGSPELVELDAPDGKKVLISADWTS